MSRFIHRSIFAALLAPAIVLGAIVVGATSPAVAAAPAPAGDVIDATNSQRAASGLRPLAEDSSLDVAAQEWADHMSSTGTFGHSSNEFRAARIATGWDTNGENIAYGYSSAASVVSAWMDSTGHRENILRKTYTRIGIGYSANGRYWVQVFAGYAEDRLPGLTVQGAAALSGTAKVGNTLTAVVPTFSPDAEGYSYQWYSNNIPLSGQTASTFRVKSTDVGEQISVGVTGSRGGYYSATSRSAAVVPVTNLLTSRLTGTDRFAVAAAISKVAFPSTAGTVFVSTGWNYPDALSAAPAAFSKQGPLLLTDRGSLPAVTRAEIERLRPASIVIVGGRASVSDAVLAELQTLAATVTRIDGVDRYEVSRKLATFAFGRGAATAYVATGNTFPDALSSGSAAGRAGAPLVLVNGWDSSVDSSTLALFGELGTSSFKIAGGSASVSPGVMESLKNVTSNIRRLSGADRFAASLAINADAYPTAQRAYLATAMNFPDALTGSVLAAKDNAPLFVVPADCVPQSVLSQLTRSGVRDVVLLGGSASLTPAVERLEACSF